MALAVTGGPVSECLSQKYNIRITRGDLATLVGLQWLNDEVRYNIMVSAVVSVLLPHFLGD